MPQPLHYDSHPPPHRRWRAVYLILLVLIASLIYGLHRLSIMPYRPPQDMSTFLGGPELAFVHSLMFFLSIAWVIVLALFCHDAWTQRRKFR